jgi:hypothetical protein
MHMRRMSAYTYVMEIQGTATAAFKVGWAFDYKAREREFNATAMPKLGGLRCKPVLFQQWSTAMQAFRMEQWLLHKLDSLRHPANHEIVTPMTFDKLKAVWLEYLLKKRSVCR